MQGGLSARTHRSRRRSRSRTDGSRVKVRPDSPADPPTMAMPSGRRSSDPTPMPTARGNAPKQGCRRRHHDRSEPQQAGFINRRLGVFLLPVRSLCKAKSIIMMAFFFTMPISSMNSDQRNHAQFRLEQQQCQQGSHPGGRQAWKNRDRMNVTLIENPQHDVHRDQRRQNQPGVDSLQKIGTPWPFLGNVPRTLAGKPMSCMACDPPPPPPRTTRQPPY